jgi:hypothetical protein
MDVKEIANLDIENVLWLKTSVMEVKILIASSKRSIITRMIK